MTIPADSGPEMLDQLLTGGPDRHQIRLHLREDLHRGETLVLETAHSPAGLAVTVLDLVSDQRLEPASPDVFVIVEEITSA